MSEEEAKKLVDTIKQEEFPYALAIAKAYEKLEEENKELKEQYSKLEDKYIKNQPCCNENGCDLYKEYLNDKNILTEFEKWLEIKIKRTKEQDTKDYHSEINLIVSTYQFVLNKLQELKEGKK